MRIDRYLFEQGFCRSRTQGQALVESGVVFCNGKPVTKASFVLPEGAWVELRGEGPRYVSRGGLKLAAALKTFSLSVEGLTAVDIGASTGGFTDCLLQAGCRRVYAVDAGSGQLDISLRKNPAVVSLENCNARHLTVSDIGEPCDLCVMDVSFISQTLLHPVAASLLRPGGFFLSLIKPQFEVGKQKVGKGGIVRDSAARKGAVDKVIASAEAVGFVCERLMESPITGGDGNTEFLALFRLAGKANLPD